MYTLKKLTKVRPLRPSVMFSTPLVAPKLCDCNWFFIFARDCRHRTQIPIIFREKELIYTFSPYTSLNKQLCMWQKNKTSLGKSPTNPKLMKHSVVNLVTNQYFTFLSFFFPALLEGILMSVNKSIRAFPTPLISFDRSTSIVLNKFWKRRYPCCMMTEILSEWTDALCVPLHHKRHLQYQVKNKTFFFCWG